MPIPAVPAAVTEPRPEPTNAAPQRESGGSKPTPPSRDSQTTAAILVALVALLLAGATLTAARLRRRGVGRPRVGPSAGEVRPDARPRRRERDAPDERPLVMHLNIPQKRRGDGESAEVAGTPDPPPDRAPSTGRRAADARGRDPAAPRQPAAAAQQPAPTARQPAAAAKRPAPTAKQPAPTTTKQPATAGKQPATAGKRTPDAGKRASGAAGAETRGANRPGRPATAGQRAADAAKRPGNARSTRAANRPSRVTDGGKRPPDTDRPPQPLAPGDAVIGYLTLAKSAVATEAALNEIDSVCSQAGWDLKDIVHDESVPSMFARPGLARALERIAAGEARGLVVGDVMRLARSLPELALLLEWLNDVGGALVAPALDLDTSTPDGDRLARTLVTVDGWESRRAPSPPGRRLAAVRTSRRRGGSA
jgi:hypothetical protein